MPKAVREALGLAAVAINSLLGEDYGLAKRLAAQHRPQILGANSPVEE